MSNTTPNTDTTTPVQPQQAPQAAARCCFPSFVEVASPAHDRLLLIPEADIVHMPTTAQQQQQDTTRGDAGRIENDVKFNVQLCPRFDADRPMDSCPRGFKCKYVHAIVDRAVSQDVHVNYVWRDASDVVYDRFAKGKVFHVAIPNAASATDEIPSHLVLKTRVLQSNRRVISHCAHYYFNRMCNRGSSCYFVHAVSLAPADQVLAIQQQQEEERQEHSSNKNNKGKQVSDANHRKIYGRMTLAAADGSPLPQQHNNNSSSNMSCDQSIVDCHEEFYRGAATASNNGSSNSSDDNYDHHDQEEEHQQGVEGEQQQPHHRLPPPPPYASAVASVTCTCDFCMAAASAAIVAGTPTAACPMFPNPAPERAAHCGCNCCSHQQVLQAQQVVKNSSFHSNATVSDGCRVSASSLAVSAATSPSSSSSTHQQQQSVVHNNSNHYHNINNYNNYYYGYDGYPVVPMQALQHFHAQVYDQPMQPVALQQQQRQQQHQFYSGSDDEECDDDYYATSLPPSECSDYHEDYHHDRDGCLPVQVRVISVRYRHEPYSMTSCQICVKKTVMTFPVA